MSEFVIPAERVSVSAFSLPAVSRYRRSSHPVLANTREFAVDAGETRFKEVSSEALVLEVAMLEPEGMPVLQLPAVPQRLEEVLFQLSTVCAPASTANTAPHHHYDGAEKKGDPIDGGVARMGCPKANVQPDATNLRPTQTRQARDFP